MALANQWTLHQIVRRWLKFVELEEEWDLRWHFRDQKSHLSEMGDHGHRQHWKIWEENRQVLKQAVLTWDGSRESVKKTEWKVNIKSCSVPWNKNWKTAVSCKKGNDANDWQVKNVIDCIHHSGSVGLAELTFPFPALKILKNCILSLESVYILWSSYLG